MPTLVELYGRPGVAQYQRDSFWDSVTSLAKGNDPELVLRESLTFLCRSYDAGGISCGRSLRSRILEEAMKSLRNNDRIRAGKLIAVLTAMYHDHEYITRAGWYDQPIGNEKYGSSFIERVHLGVLSILLKVDQEIPDVSGFTIQDFETLLKN